MLLHFAAHIEKWIAAFDKSEMKCHSTLTAYLICMEYDTYHRARKSEEQSLWLISSES